MYGCARIRMRAGDDLDLKSIVSSYVQMVSVAGGATTFMKVVKSTVLSTRGGADVKLYIDLQCY